MLEGGQRTTRRMRELQGETQRDGRCRAQSLPCIPVAKFHLVFFGGGSFLLTQSVGEGFLSTLLRVEVAVMVLA